MSREHWADLGETTFVGGTWFLQRGPGHVPMYLGLTGVAIGGTDSLYAGLVDACFSPASIAARNSSATFLFASLIVLSPILPLPVNSGR